HVEDGERAGQWYIELESTTLLEHNGWNADTLKLGDRIEVEGVVARDGSPQLWSSRLARANGEELFTIEETLLDAAKATGAGEPVPRWPDGQPRLGAEPGQTGYWIPVTTVLREDGVDVEMSPHGLLADIGDASRVAPFQEWALRL